ncbi:unnamed protein product [Amoebophrya sp. A120]|nr:unnamed protein product [Amoebophrya sp. A120]|eukprot:GSA120T00002464001.1
MFGSVLLSWSESFHDKENAGMNLTCRQMDAIAPASPHIRVEEGEAGRSNKVNNCSKSSSSAGASGDEAFAYDPNVALSAASASSAVGRGTDKKATQTRKQRPPTSGVVPNSSSSTFNTPRSSCNREDDSAVDEEEKREVLDQAPQTFGTAVTSRQKTSVGRAEYEVLGNGKQAFVTETEAQKDTPGLGFRRTDETDAHRCLDPYSATLATASCFQIDLVGKEDKPPRSACRIAAAPWYVKPGFVRAGVVRGTETGETAGERRSKHRRNRDRNRSAKSVEDISFFYSSDVVSAVEKYRAAWPEIWQYAEKNGTKILNARRAEAAGKRSSSKNNKRSSRDTEEVFDAAAVLFCQEEEVEVHELDASVLRNMVCQAAGYVSEQAFAAAPLVPWTHVALHDSTVRKLAAALGVSPYAKMAPIAAATASTTASTFTSRPLHMMSDAPEKFAGGEIFRPIDSAATDDLAANKGEDQEALADTVSVSSKESKRRGKKKQKKGIQFKASSPETKVGSQGGPSAMMSTLILDEHGAEQREHQSVGRQAAKTINPAGGGSNFASMRGRIPVPEPPVILLDAVRNVSWAEWSGSSRSPVSSATSSSDQPDVIRSNRNVHPLPLGTRVRCNFTDKQTQDQLQGKQGTVVLVRFGDEGVVPRGGEKNAARTTESVSSEESKKNVRFCYDILLDSSAVGCDSLLLPRLHRIRADNLVPLELPTPSGEDSTHLLPAGVLLADENAKVLPDKVKEETSHVPDSGGKYSPWNFQPRQVTEMFSAYNMASLPAGPSKADPGTIAGEKTKNFDKDRGFFQHCILGEPKSRTQEAKDIKKVTNNNIVQECSSTARAAPERTEPSQDVDAIVNTNQHRGGEFVIPRVITRNAGPKKSVPPAEQAAEKNRDRNHAETRQHPVTGIQAASAKTLPRTSDKAQVKTRKRKLVAGSMPTPVDEMIDSAKAGSGKDEQHLPPARQTDTSVNTENLLAKPVTVVPKPFLASEESEQKPPRNKKSEQKKRQTQKAKQSHAQARFLSVEDD